MLGFSHYSGYSGDELNKLAPAKLASLINSYERYVVSGGAGYDGGQVARSLVCRGFCGRGISGGEWDVGRADVGNFVGGGTSFFGNSGIAADARGVAIPSDVSCVARSVRSCGDGGDICDGVGRRCVDRLQGDVDGGGRRRGAASVRYRDLSEGVAVSARLDAVDLKRVRSEVYFGDADVCSVSGRADLLVDGDSTGDCDYGSSRQDDQEVGSVASQGRRGKHYESNRRKRLQRKARRCGLGRSAESSVGGSSRDLPTLRELVEAKVDADIVLERAKVVEQRLADEDADKRARRTLAEKWAVENELAAEKAKRALEVLRAQDLQVEIKKQSTSLRLQTERNMVGMEKAHQYLKRTGNVPGFAQTVLSDEGLTDGSSVPVSPGECTISPDSSASMKEFREVVKQKADLEEKLARICKMTKVSLEDLDDYDKNTWSLKSENYEKLDRMYPGGYILDPVPDYVDYDPPTHGYLKF